MPERPARKKAEESGRKKHKPDIGKDVYVPPREEPGTSDEIVLSGRVYYATEKVPIWPPADASRQYIASPDDMQDIQHGVVTYVDAASDTCQSDEIDRREEPYTEASRRKKQPPDLEL